MSIEYVILVLLAAAAVVVGVVLFGRSVWCGVTTASEGATLQHTKAKDNLDQRVVDRAGDTKTAKAYHEAFHE
jgi:hypothetical protein